MGNGGWHLSAVAWHMMTMPIPAAFANKSYVVSKIDEDQTRSSFVRSFSDRSVLSISCAIKRSNAAAPQIFPSPAVYRRRQ